MRIDAHQHFWLYSPEKYGWISPEMPVLMQDRLPDDLFPLLQAAELDGSVAVQARHAVEETRWLLELADRNAWIKGIVGWVDLRGTDTWADLEKLCAWPKFRGVRHLVQNEPDDEFMLRPDFQRGVAALAQFGLTYDILIYPRHLPVACDLVARFPDQPFVLDHIAKPSIKDGILEPWATDIRRLAAHHNVCCKVSGLVTEADWHGWQQSDCVPYLDVVFEAFGPARIMYGSDWPVCTLAPGSGPSPGPSTIYGRVAAIVAEYVHTLSDSEQADVWGQTATRFYGLE